MLDQKPAAVRFSDLRFTRIYAGGDGTPKHVFLHCPHVKRMMGHTNVASVYRLGPNSRTLNLIQCKWCRSRYLTLMIEDPEVPEDLIRALSLVPKGAPFEAIPED